MMRTLVPVTALALAGPALVVLAPTSPTRPPLAPGAALTLGLGVGVVLFAALARSVPLTLFTPLAAVVGAVGVSEEAIWRGFALGRIEPLAGPTVAVAVTTLAFASTHVPLLRLRGAAVQLVTGGAFGILFVTSGSLLACATAHAAYNVFAVAARRAPASAAIELRRVTKRFADTIVLDSLDLAVEQGEVVALLGPNGAGKTTLASLCVGLRRPTSGSVRVLGGDPCAWSTRLRLGVMPQQMDFPPTLRGAELLDLARAHAGNPPPLQSLVRRFGLDGTVDRQTGALSGGQRRRLALALAFANAPDVVVLDEPTAGLDVESRLRAWDALRAFDGTVLLTTHHLEEAEGLADRILVLADGAIASEVAR